MKISDELIAAYLDGRTNKEETLQVVNAIKNDDEVRKFFEIILTVEAEVDQNIQAESHEKRETRIINMRRDIIPIMQLAAKNDECTCSVECEAYVLERRDITFDSKELVGIARENNWLRAEGTPLHAIGQVLVNKGLLITRKYDSTLDDIGRFLNMDNDIIVAVCEHKLYDKSEESNDDANHAVVVTSIDNDFGIVTIYDNGALEDIPMDNFCRAWNYSHNYMVRVLQSPLEYEPEPILLDNVTIDDELIDLREAIAENLHDVWSINRINEGWTYGNKRDDDTKKHPDLIPYCALPDSEKEYDRQMAWNTLKLVKKLGFSIEKK